ncbi:hypothetical protein Q7P35_006315 [Cladosporium inversicolor]
MSAIFEDHEPVDKHLFHEQTESLNLRVLEWRHSDDQDHQDHHEQRTDITLTSASSLIARDAEETSCPLRIVFAPRDAKHSAEHRAVRLLYPHYDIPSSFTLLKTTSPTHAFGHRKGLKDPNVEIAWTRFLCKDIFPLDTQHHEAFHDNFRWIVCDTFLHVRKHKDEAEKKSVTLLFFGAPPKVVQRFERLLGSDAWADAVQEPYVLLALVYEQLFLLLDKAAWTLAGWFRSKERSALNSVRQDCPSHVVEATDFATLHEIAKHGIYMIEAAAAAVLQMETIIAHLQDLSTNTSPPPTTLLQTTISHLSSRKSSCQSTHLRLTSLSARITNVISLSFNLVTQRDSQVLKQDSNAMKAIALLTLVFLPLTGIASLFSTPFFEVVGSHLWVSASIWIFWVVTVCLTGSVMVVWGWWYRGMKERTGRKLKRERGEKGG